MSDEMPRARRRERRADNPRSHRVNLAYNDVELAIIMTAAAVAGLKPAAYAARAALAVAKEEVSPRRWTTRTGCGCLPMPGLRRIGSART